MFKNCGPSSCEFLAKRTDPIKDKLGSQQPSQGTFEIPKLNFSKAKLDHNSSKISRTEWNAYFEAAKYYQESKIASLQNKILRLTEANR